MAFHPSGQSLALGLDTAEVLVVRLDRLPRVLPMPPLRQHVWEGNDSIGRKAPIQVIARIQLSKPSPQDESPRSVRLPFQKTYWRCGNSGCVWIHRTEPGPPPILGDLNKNQHLYVGGLSTIPVSASEPRLLVSRCNVAGHEVLTKRRVSSGWLP